MKKYILLLAVLFFFIQCSKKIAPVENKNASPEEAFSTTCKRCHKLPDPQKHTVAEWPKIVDKMQRKGHFSDEQKSRILSFLSVNTRK